MKGLRIVVGTDSPSSAHAIRQAVEQMGHEVIAEVTSGTQALKLHREAHPDLMILDVSLPELSGIDACRSITAQRPIPAILIGWESGEDLVEQAYAAGAMAYLVKPVDKILYPALEFAVAKFREIERLREEVAVLKEALEARKVIERAKGLIMSKLRIAENDAYRILQKYSRDRNLRLKDVAQSVLSSINLFGSANSVAVAGV